jgi:vacuolar-type H+-ATPase subunit I/STV1
VKKSKLSKLIQKPLRFHHQDIHEEIEGLTELLLNINNRLVAIERKLEAVSSPHNSTALTCSKP